MCPPIATGNAVSAYTGSPWRAFLVEMACFKDNGILVPEGTVIVFVRCSELGVAAVELPVPAACVAGLACAQPSAAHNKTNVKMRTNTSPVRLQYRLEALWRREPPAETLSLSKGLVLWRPFDSLALLGRSGQAEIERSGSRQPRSRAQGRRFALLTVCRWEVPWGPRVPAATRYLRSAWPCARSEARPRSPRSTSGPCCHK